jgi:hypothetical protein
VCTVVEVAAQHWVMDAASWRVVEDLKNPAHGMVKHRGGARTDREVRAVL